ncbi:MAG: hypothetical protein JST49_05535 [Bacteroidetes bacterium]|nr:hypothetical protein [Bacteroidota bacterium]
MKAFLQKNGAIVSRTIIIILFIAALRCIAEFFRLYHIHGAQLSVMDVWPFILGALIAITGCLLAYILSLFNKTLLMGLVLIVTIAAMLVVKAKYSLP